MRVIRPPVARRKWCPPPRHTPADAVVGGAGARPESRRNRAPPCLDTSRRPSHRPARRSGGRRRARRLRIRQRRAGRFECRGPSERRPDRREERGAHSASRRDRHRWGCRGRLDRRCSGDHHHADGYEGTGHDHQDEQHHEDGHPAADDLSHRQAVDQRPGEDTLYHHDGRGRLELWRRWRPPRLGLGADRSGSGRPPGSGIRDWPPTTATRRATWTAGRTNRTAGRTTRTTRRTGTRTAKRAPDPAVLSGRGAPPRSVSKYAPFRVKGRGRKACPDLAWATYPIPTPPPDCPARGATRRSSR